MRLLLALVFGILAILGHRGDVLAQPAPVIPTPACAWPYLFSPLGLGNATYPDALARYWFIPFDAKWRQMTIRGAYPKARYFSVVAYDNYVPTAIAGGLADAVIEPDPGAGTYTVTVTTDPNAAGPNVVHMNAGNGWVLYRLYLPGRGEAMTGGVPLPEITVTTKTGETQALAPCRTVNGMHEFLQVLQTFFPPGLELVGGRPASGDRIWFAPPLNPPMRLLPNPHIKYMGAQPQFSYHPGKVIVIRGKMPGYPDTFGGAGVTQPASGFGAVQLRYWSLCQGDLALPVPLVNCTTDALTPVDGDGFYTIVVSDDLVRPGWLPGGAAWLPWGDEMVLPKLMVNRNMLPADDFVQSIQAAFAAGCTFPFDLPNIPDPDAMEKAGQCARKVMAEYYPDAAWCKRETFISGGWQECFRAANIPASP